MEFTTLRSIISTIQAISRVIDDPVKETGKIINDAGDAAKDTVMTGNNIVTITKALRVRPICIETEDAAMYDDIEVIEAALLELYGAYYIQAFSMISNVVDARAKSALASLSTESITEHDLSKGLLVSTEKSAGTKFSKEDIHTLARLIELTLVQKDDTKITLPIQLELPIHRVSLDTARRIMDLKGENKRFFSRFMQWRAGEIEFWKDLVFAQDLIKEHKKVMTEDDDGVITTLVKRSNADFKKMISGTATHNSINTLSIITSDDLRYIEREIVGGSMNKSRFRNKFFSSNMLLMLVVVDPDWDNVTIYTRELDSYTTVPVKSLIKKSKSGNNDLVEIMKAFIAGNSPVL